MLPAPEFLAIKIHVGRNSSDHFQQSGKHVTFVVIWHFHLFNKCGVNTYYVPGLVGFLAKNSEIVF